MGVKKRESYRYLNAIVFISYGFLMVLNAIIFTSYGWKQVSCKYSQSEILLFAIHFNSKVEHMQNMLFSNFSLK